MKKYLVAGLGNKGIDYAFTRHNVGFEILDLLASQEDLSFETKRLGDLTTYKFKGREFLLLKPNTFMNLSGKAIQYWLTKENIPLENLLVITDDLNLDFGTLRLKAKGSDGGHNGLRHIQQTLNTTKYSRLRFGVGSQFSRGQQIDYVLGKWSEEEQEQLQERLEKSVEIIKSFGTAGLARTMNKFNGK